MKHASALRRLFAFAIVASPFVVVIACSTPDSHPAIVGGCSGPNCPPQGQAAISGGSSSGSDGSTTTDDGSTTDDSGTGDDGSITGSE